MPEPIRPVHEAILTYFVRTRRAIVEGAFGPHLGRSATYTAAVLGNAVVIQKDHIAGGLSRKSGEACFAPLEVIRWF